MPDPSLEISPDEVVLEVYPDETGFDVTDETTELQIIDEVVQLEISEDSIDLEIRPDVIELEISEGLQGPPGASGASSEEEVAYDVQVDTTDPVVTYVGQAEPGTANSASAWRIKRITETSSEVAIDWANGTADFVHSWDDHLTLPYGP